MPFPFDKYPWLNFQELNLAYFITHFREIFEQWDTLLHEMYDWKDATDAELAEWKSTVETGISSWETGLQQSMEDWKDATETDISEWEGATLTALDAWKTATTAVFEQIRTEAAASATAAAGSAASAQTALAGAQAAQAAAEAAAAGIQSELSQIQTNTADIADLKTQIRDDLFLLSNNYLDVKNVNLWKHGTISGTGEITDAHTQSNTYTIPLITFPLKYEVDTNQNVYLCKYLNGSFVSRTQVGKKGKVSFDGTFDSYRLMLTNSNSGTMSVADMVNIIKYMVSIKKANDDMFDDEIVAEINGNLKTANVFERGYIDDNGNLLDNSNNGAITTVTLKLPTVFNIPNTLRYNIATYNNGTFVSRGVWTDGTGENVTITENEYKIMFSQTAQTGTYDIDDTLSLVTYFSTKNKYDLEQANKFNSKLNYINKTNCTWTGNKICHFSVDDTYALIKDLTDNAETYTSIFDNSTLSTLKTIHDSTGLCITFNTFNTLSTDNTYSISNVPQKAAFQSEFQANKNWLRFAFHGEYDYSKYDSSPNILTSYNTFVSAIYKLTGDYGCIDRFTRLGFFAGSLENVLKIKDIEHGITGLLCADATNRDSYYLDAEQNKIVQQKGMYVDADNEIIMLKSITRDFNNMSAEIENNLCYQKYVEVFTHEYETNWTTGCGNIATWLKNNGFVFAFPSDIFDVT